MNQFRAPAGQMRANFNAIVSSDWSECLAPCGPFDCIAFNFPELEPELTRVFRQYTGNSITLGEAAAQIRKMLPGLITRQQMDAYLDRSFVTYNGVPELIEWCLGNDILFMINTTGMIGYFQRVFAKSLLPRIPILSAHPMIRYPRGENDPHHIYELSETPDKGHNTESAVRLLGIPPEKIIVMGDSGGDGPHFKWGAARGAFLIGSMTKPSLDRYCRENKIGIGLRFGLDYSRDESRDPQKELQLNFMDLAPVMEDIAKRR
jgi:2-hydroxy-3-keto-5-methylthiopentenyl-1-phosphate phosphatase